jgi:hypothetical protein
MKHFILTILCALALTACGDRRDNSDFANIQAVKEKYAVVSHIPAGRWYYIAVKEDGSIWFVATLNSANSGFISQEAQLFSAEEIKRVVNSATSVK